MSESRFSTFTLWQYRNLAVLCLVAGAFFLGFGGTGFKGGLNVGLGVELLTVAVAFLALRRYVRNRLHQPVEYWRDQQRRLSRPVWGGTAAFAGAGGITVLAALLGGAAWVAGFAGGMTALPALLLIGKATGQIRPL